MKHGNVVHLGDVESVAPSPETAQEKETPDCGTRRWPEGWFLAPMSVVALLVWGLAIYGLTRLF